MEISTEEILDLSLGSITSDSIIKSFNNLYQQKFAETQNIL